jgi:hypothetical protein
MSATNSSNQTEASDTPAQGAPEPPIVPPGSGWFQRLSSILFIIFCFELGLFLLIYPWTDGWTDNYFASAVPGSVMTGWHIFWDNRYVRGCISGVGIVNLWIAVAEVFRLFSRRTPGSVPQQHS